MRSPSPSAHPRPIPSPPPSPLLFSPGGGDPGLPHSGQTGLFRAAHSSGRKCQGDSSAKWPELMTSRLQGWRGGESWASACRKKKKKRALPYLGRFTPSEPSGPGLRQTDNYLEDDIFMETKNTQRNPRIPCCCLLQLQPGFLDSLMVPLPGSRPPQKTRRPP